MKRRRFLAASVVSIGAPCFVVAQQPGKVHRIGFLSSSSPQGDRGYLGAFERGLRELGYSPGKNFTIEERYASGQFDMLPELAAELVRLGVDVLVVAGAPAARAAKKATATVPIVIVAVADPVGIGLVASLARPGGNITGLADLNTDVVGKRLEFLREVVPAANPIAVVFNPTNPTNPLQLKLTQAAAIPLRVTLLPFEVKAAGDIDQAFAVIRSERCGALLAIGDPFLRSQMRKIIDLSQESRLPAMYSEKQYPEAGGLMSYGANRDDLYRRGASYVDKILKGATPAELPVEQPVKFELVVNLKTAKALGVVVPPSVLVRADEVIE